MRAAGDSAWVRKTEDLTTDKTDDKDAVLIARLTAQLRCYLPEPVDETWGRLRHLGTRREQLIEEHVGACSRSATCSSACGPPPWRPRSWPFRSATWVAALAVVVDRDGGDLERTRRLGAARFERAVRKEVVRRGGQRPCLRIVRNAVRRPVRPGRGAGAPAGRVRTDRLGPRGLGPRQEPPWSTPRPGWSPCSTSWS